MVAFKAEVAAPEAKDDNAKRANHTNRHEDAINDHVEDQLWTKDAVFYLSKVSRYPFLMRDRTRTS